MQCWAWAGDGNPHFFLVSFPAHEYVPTELRNAAHLGRGLGELLKTRNEEIK